MEAQSKFFPSIELETAIKVIEPEMFDSMKMKTIYESNIDLLKQKYKEYCEEKGDVDIRSFIPYIYHEGITYNILNLNKLEKTQFEIYLRDLDCDVNNMERGHFNWFGNVLFRLASLCVDDQTIKNSRNEVLKDRGICISCEEKKCKCNESYEDDDEWEICTICNKRFCQCDDETY